MFDENEPLYRLIELVSGIHLKTRHWTESQIVKLEMTYPQLGALMALHKKEGITQRELAEMIETDTTTAMVICNSLEKKGWLKRKTDIADKRINRLKLTDAGRDVYFQAMAHIQKGYDSLMSSTRSDELKRILPFMEKIYRDLGELLNSMKR